MSHLTDEFRINGWRIRFYSSGESHIDYAKNHLLFPSKQKALTYLEETSDESRQILELMHMLESGEGEDSPPVSGLEPTDIRDWE